MALLLKTTLAAAFLASALAAEISTDDGHVNVRVSRAKEFRATRDMEQTASLFKVMEDVATIKDQMKGASNAIEFNKLLSPYVGTSINRIDGLTKDVAAVGGKVDGVVSSVKDQVEQLAKELKADAAKRAEEMQKKLDDLTKANAQLKKDLVGANEKASTALSKAVDDKLKAADAKLEKGLAKVTSAMSVKRGVWIGGTTHSYRRGWHKFQLNRLEVDSSAPYFKLASSTEFVALKTGLYRMMYEGIGHGGWCHNHAQWFINNKPVVASAHWWNPGTWQTQHQEATFVVKQGQNMYFRIYGCNYATHGGSLNNPNAHNRITVEYMGEVGDQCKGKFCNGL